MASITNDQSLINPTGVSSITSIHTFFLHKLIGHFQKGLIHKTSEIKITSKEFKPNLIAA